MQPRGDSVRTVMIGMPRLLAGLIGEAIDAVLVVATFDEAKDLTAAVTETQADFLVVRARPGWDADFTLCCEHHPRLRALAIDRDERGAVVCELRPHAARLPRLDLAAVVDAIRERPEWTFEMAS